MPGWTRRAALAALASAAAQGARAAPVAGTALHEAAFGLRLGTLEDETAYWARFGYAVAAEGRLSALQSLVLYGLLSDVATRRLRHVSGAGAAVRLMAWTAPTGAGAGAAPLFAPGARFVASEAAQLSAIERHARAAGAVVLGPIEAALGAPTRPWIDRAPGVRRLVALDPLRRRVFSEVSDGETALPAAPPGTLPTGPVNHFGAAVGTLNEADFYADVLGFIRTAPTPQQDGAAFAQGLTVRQAAFRDAAGLTLTLAAVEFGAPKPVRAQPGDLGLSLFTVRTPDIAALRASALEAGARQVSPVLRNEFGEEAVGFFAPDGSAWQAVAG